MPVTIQVGTMMIQEGLLLPTTVELESDSYSEGWRSVKNLDSFSLDRNIRTSGWHLFFMAEQLQVIVFGCGGEKTVSRGVKRIAVKVRSLGFNCMELTQIVIRHFLGIPYVVISAHPYHIQESYLLQSTNGRLRLQCDADLGAELRSRGHPPALLPRDEPTGVSGEHSIRPLLRLQEVRKP
jgi:hypothetical protein